MWNLRICYAYYYESVQSRWGMHPFLAPALLQGFFAANEHNGFTLADEQSLMNIWGDSNRSIPCSIYRTPCPCDQINEDFTAELLLRDSSMHFKFAQAS